MRDFWRNLPLRTRLTALSVGLLTALLGAFGGVVYLNLRRFLIQSTALRMRAQAKAVIERQLPPLGRHGLDEIAPGLSQALTSRDTTATIFDPRGALLANGRRLPEEPAAAPPRPAHLGRAAAGEKEVTYTASSDRQRSLVTLIPLRRAPDSAEVLGVAQLTTPLNQVDQILSRQRRMIGLGTLFTLGVGALGEIWLIRSSLRPLKRVIATIQRLAAGDLGQRVELAHTRDEVGQLATAFDHMAGNLELAFASQSRFVSAAAHELRTPLTALQGSLEVLQRGSQDDPAATRRLLQGMHREVRRLSRLTEQLLTLTRLDAPEALHLKPVDLPRFLDEWAVQAGYLVSQRHFRLVRGPAVTLSADPDLLTQVFLNLVDNAVQHTEPAGQIELGWSASGRFAAVWVADDGEGILPEDLPHVFETFYRGDRSRSQRHGGTGLGLAIVHAIVQAHGGSVEVQSQPGHGTRITLALPLWTDE